MKRQRRIAAQFVLAILLVGGLSCATSSPRAEVSYRIEPWSEFEPGGGVLLTPHYAIHTTVIDPTYQRRLAAVMESAFRQYTLLAPAQGKDPTPLNCFVFRRRAEWTAFTTRQAPADASTYLRINRGGYTIGDEFAVFSSGVSATCSAAAHEGWHQYVARHFIERMPPFLEEGLACTFENVRIDDDGRVIIDTSQNHNRARALRMAAESGQLFALEDLLALHAGEVVELPSPRVEAFYAQCWAFARFLLAADETRYRDGLRSLLESARRGELDSSIPTAARKDNRWTRDSSRLLLERYLHSDLDEIDAAYHRWVSRIIDEDARHWRREQ